MGPVTAHIPGTPFRLLILLMIGGMLAFKHLRVTFRREFIADMIMIEAKNAFGIGSDYRFVI